MWAIFGNAVSSEKFSSNFNDIAGAAAAAAEVQRLRHWRPRRRPLRRAVPQARTSPLRAGGVFRMRIAAALRNKGDVFRT
jgi:hypothetical protein